MAIESHEFDASAAQANFEKLADNPYPGRGIILGRSQNPEELVEAYWVMGRSENSRNRILVQDGDIVRTAAFDIRKVIDPSLVIHNAMRLHREHALLPGFHIVSSGNQTDSVYNAIIDAETTRLDSNPFEEALLKRDFEPDSPNFTPRITGAIAIGLSWSSNYGYSIIRRNPTTGMSEHTFGSGHVEDIPSGTGLCFHTYQFDGDPIPPFEGSPYAVPLGSSAEGIAEELWEALDKENRVGVAVRTIGALRGEILDTKIINQLHK
jgi:hypothetical protein